MPELPDVETFKNYLEKTSLNQKIKNADVRNNKILKKVSKQKLNKELKGNALKSTQRHGKHLFVALENKSWLEFHFGMTGFLKYFKDIEEDTKHDRFMITFSNGHHLTFDNQRLLGYVSLTDSPQSSIKEQKLGPDALDIDYKYFKEILSYPRATVKSTLMNQSKIAGIGNIYSDEIFYKAGINPGRKNKDLKEKDIKILFSCLKKVLKTAIEKKTQPKDLPKTWLLRYREQGQVCPKCRGKIKRKKFSGRGSYYCPKCQK